jgi:ribosomal protein S18 acetylase RimI-like enzyme
VAIDVRPLQPVPSDRAWAAGVLRASWGGTEILSRGRSHDAATLPGLVAELDGDPVGLATYAIEEGQCELVTLDSLAPRRGVGGALLDGVVLAAREAGCARVWLVTTNDNLAALRFYQRRGSTSWPSTATR